MANTRLSMRKTREILRICWGSGLSVRQAAKGCGVGRSTVKECLERAEKAGLTWPLPEEFDDARPEGLLFPSAIPLTMERSNMPPFDYIHKELLRKHVTLQLLWHEYRGENPDGYQYSQFCLRYRAWVKTLDVSMRQTYKAGEKLFVDFAGDAICINDPAGGAVRQGVEREVNYFLPSRNFGVLISATSHLGFLNTTGGPARSPGPACLATDHNSMAWQKSWRASPL
ncbi:MAG: hypothetical protein M0P30_13885 [Syntrophorhabdaceae bacterium]|nr:hypothetical protein [Syntrophorhabdaceae bacterium]